LKPQVMEPRIKTDLILKFKNWNWNHTLFERTKTKVESHFSEEKKAESNWNWFLQTFRNQNQRFLLEPKNHQKLEVSHIRSSLHIVTLRLGPI
jgi:hypothetical protein